ncbi:MAG: hypothetical protein ABEJ42_07215 [Halobacteriaceae archaeon]
MTRRAVSTVLGYVLALGITTLLVSGIMLAGGGFVDAQRERVVHSELEVLVERLASDVDRADRLALATDADGAVRIDTPLPRTVAGFTYRITVTQVATPTDHPSRYRLTATIESDAVDVSESTTVAISTDDPSGELSNGLQETTVRGGDLVVVYHHGSDSLEVRHE